MTQASGAMLKERKKLERKRNFKRMWVYPKFCVNSKCWH